MISILQHLSIPFHLWHISIQDDKRWNPKPVIPCAPGDLLAGWSCCTKSATSLSGGGPDAMKGKRISRAPILGHSKVAHRYKRRHLGDIMPGCKKKLHESQAMLIWSRIWQRIDMQKGVAERPKSHLSARTPKTAKSPDWQEDRRRGLG